MPTKLRTQQDGRKLAIRSLRRIVKAGPDACSASRTVKDADGAILEVRKEAQADPIIRAMLELSARGTAQAVTGFAVVLTDALGSEPADNMADHFQDRENAGKLEDWKGY